MDSKQTVQVGIVLGSASDLDKVKPLFGVLDEFGVSYELAVISAHRTPKLLDEYARSVSSRGIKVVIAAAGAFGGLAGSACILGGRTCDRYSCEHRNS